MQLYASTRPLCHPCTTHPGAQATTRRGPSGTRQAAARAQAAAAAREHGQGAFLGRAPARLLCLLRARLAALGSSGKLGTPRKRPIILRPISPRLTLQARERELPPGRLHHARAGAAGHAVPAVPGGAPQVHRGRCGRAVTPTTARRRPRGIWDSDLASLWHLCSPSSGNLCNANAAQHMRLQPLVLVFSSVFLCKRAGGVHQHATRHTHTPQEMGKFGGADGASALPLSPGPLAVRL